MKEKLDKEIGCAIVNLFEKKKDKSHLLYHLIPTDKDLKKIKGVASHIRSNSDTLIVVGIGGSSLSSKIFEKIGKEKKLIILEGVDEREFIKKINEVDLTKCSLNIVSKSGNTLETIANSALLIKRFKKIFGNFWKDRVILTASPSCGKLQKWAEKEKIRIVEIPEEVGGRFSTFTAVGLLPAQFLKLNIDEIKKGAEEGLEESLKIKGKNEAVKITKFYLLSDLKGISNIYVWGYGSLSYSFAQYLQQLWDESLGKKIVCKGKKVRKGLSVIPLKGSEDQHSVLQLLVDGPQNFSTIFISEKSRKIEIESSLRKFIGLKDDIKYFGQIQDAIKEGTKKSFEKKGVDVMEIELVEKERLLGKKMATLIVSTLLIAEVLKVNPFNQEGVEESKIIAKNLLT